MEKGGVSPREPEGIDALFGNSSTEPNILAAEYGGEVNSAIQRVTTGTPKRRPSVASRIIGVAGEILITAGVLVLLFIGWRMWFEGLTLNAAQENEAAGLSELWNTPAASEPPPPTEPPSNPAVPAASYGEPVVMSSGDLAEGEKFAVLYVPRFGENFKRTIAEGVDPKSVLNLGGAGHYTQTAMPGAVGNFAIAAHRDGWGSPFMKINELQLGDAIYVETQDGWYTYRYRSTEYVTPYGIGVLEPVPQVEGAAATDRVITLTSCNPLYIASERVIAYGVLESWQPRSAGPPAEIASVSAAG